MHSKHNLLTAGLHIGEAKKALLLLHGRGGSAQDILSLTNYLQVADYALLAPQATGNTWYPQSFLAPREHNEPALSSALEVVKAITTDIVQAGIPKENIFILGFSQGACLTLEFAANNAGKWGGFIAFTGGLIGDTPNTDRYYGHFEQTPIFIGSSNPDPHVPVLRVEESARLLASMGASVTKKIYPNMGHTINKEEIEAANNLLNAASTNA